MLKLRKQRRKKARARRAQLFSGWRDLDGSERDEQPPLRDRRASIYECMRRVCERGMERKLRIRSQCQRILATVSISQVTGTNITSCLCENVCLCTKRSAREKAHKNMHASANAWLLSDRRLFNSPECQRLVTRIVLPCSHCWCDRFRTCIPNVTDI